MTELQTIQWSCGHTLEVEINGPSHEENTLTAEDLPSNACPICNPEEWE